MFTYKSFCDGYHLHQFCHPPALVGTIMRDDDDKAMKADRHNIIICSTWYYISNYNLEFSALLQPRSFQLLH